MIATPDLSRDSNNLLRAVGKLELHDDRHHQAALVAEGNHVELVLASELFSLCFGERFQVAGECFAIRVGNSQPIVLVVEVLQTGIAVDAFRQFFVPLLGERRWLQFPLIGLVFLGVSLLPTARDVEGDAVDRDINVVG